jgi:hypothetical protein
MTLTRSPALEALHRLDMRINAVVPVTSLAYGVSGLVEVDDVGRLPFLLAFTVNLAMLGTVQLAKRVVRRTEQAPVRD